MRRFNPVSVVFVVLCIVGWRCSGLSATFVLNEVTIRFIRDGIMVLALLIPIAAGMGINFAVTLGATTAQVGVLLAVDRQIGGPAGLFFALCIGICLSIAVGCVVGYALNRVKGKEMIATIVMGFLGTSLYQLVFMAGYGAVIPSHNREILLSRGIGVRNMVDLHSFRNTIDQYWTVTVGGVQFPVFMILAVCCTALVITYVMNTPLGQRFKAVGESREKAELLGMDVDRVRIIAIVLSTVLACLGQIVFLQNIGMLNVYTAHLKTDIFSSAALLAGGATIEKAGVRHAFLGILLFHALFIVSPQAGQNVFGNAALGEYFRSFVAYGTIAFALILNVRHARRTPNAAATGDADPA
jgi:simple sugar transport system permease protein